MALADDPSMNKALESHEPSVTPNIDLAPNPWRNHIAIIVIVGTILGCVGGVVSYFVEVYTGSHFQWTKLPSPPEPVMELLSIGKGGSDQAVYVRTASQAIYACYTHLSLKSGCVQTTLQLMQQNLQNCGAPAPFVVPPAPADVVNRQETNPCTCFGTCKQVVAVLTDGSLWEYFAQEGEYSSMGMYFRGCVGAGIGFIGCIMIPAIILAIRDWRRQSRTN